MFPVSDFNFVCCGMATFAATVGYVYAKRRRIEQPRRTEPANMESPTIHDERPDEVPIDALNESEIESPSSGSSALQNILETPVTLHPASVPSVSDESSIVAARGPLLKRKQMDDHDENNMPLEYPHNLGALYPNKRCKTPPAENDMESESDHLTVKNHLNVDSALSALEEISVLETQVVKEPKIERSQSHYESQPTIEKNIAVAPTSRIPSTSEYHPQQVPSTPEASTAKPKPNLGFESFAASFPASFSSGNGTTASGANMRPIWSSTNNFRKRHSFIDPVDGESTTSPDREEGPGFNGGLGLGSRRQDTHPYSHVTGEEDEYVQCELKGVKLFVKRGSQEFSSGILGQVKYLSNRKTSNQRLLFRREPLWKISMNTRLQPSIRCTFDTQECILRLLLAESTEPKESGFQEVVVYALKPGRFCSKKDFQNFAESVVSGVASLKNTSLEEGEIQT
ncbi:hypothetical protein BDP27DRAFT_1403239 [Rhodocollybia butyracea]|uniref:RanBD1 domain-containing protein n=1 Tax=Rhodocollybia butyracea TaxID=206335 RepID=A0A9P5PSI3_9AGAR|nr:hypothetical protein BDP27DRAFT_1403239 [Rhodocollybia butyracea]